MKWIAIETYRYQTDDQTDLPGNESVYLYLKHHLSPPDGGSGIGYESINQCTLLSGQRMVARRIGYGNTKG